ncbi:hypothetical protein CEXT_340721 [Caerostris extrusa]|uniref:Uncharacterized protein n=1 Tax=Caerostris extrusa TaxID=172846 RepID=A0AAV4XMT0_CAEEX|nr:hypothetical protein CEXT_340721 [Caerostris extrusa]
MFVLNYLQPVFHGRKSSYLTHAHPHPLTSSPIPIGAFNQKAKKEPCNSKDIGRLGGYFPSLKTRLLEENTTSVRIFSGYPRDLCNVPMSLAGDVGYS